MAGSSPFPMRGCHPQHSYFMRIAGLDFHPWIRIAARFYVCWGVGTLWIKSAARFHACWGFGALLAVPQAAWMLRWRGIFARCRWAACARTRCWS